MPKDLPVRRSRCLEWMVRPSPTASPHQSEDEDDGDIMDEVGLGEFDGHTWAVDGLLVLADGNDIEYDAGVDEAC